MKKAMNNTGKFAITLIAMFLIGFTQATIAGGKNEGPAEVKLVRSEKNKPVFQLNMNNKVADEYYVKVKDGLGNILYAETLKGTNVWRRYLLDIEESDFTDPNFKLSFEVTGVKSRKTVTYNVTRDTHVINDISIAKL